MIRTERKFGTLVVTVGPAEIRIERHFQAVQVKVLRLYAALWWPRRLWGMDFSVKRGDHFVLVVGPVQMLVC